MKQSLGFLLLTSLVFFVGCSSMEYNSTNAPRMVVAHDRTPFFHNGPAQGNGPDLSLIKGDVVEVIRKEIGYSFVRIEDGQNGYVANEALEPAHAQKPASSAAVNEKPSPTPAKQKSSSSQEAPMAKTGSTNQVVMPTFRY